MRHMRQVPMNFLNEKSHIDAKYAMPDFLRRERGHKGAEGA